MKAPLRLLVALSLLPLLGAWDILQSKSRAVEDGNAQLKTGKAEDALASYEKAAAGLPQESGVHYNRGAALFALKRYDEAALAFLRATEAKHPPLKAQAFYNLGNSFFQANKFSEAIEAYKRSLQLDPADARAKWNLELALLRKKEEDKKKQDEKDKDKDKKDDKKKDDQDKSKDDKQDDKKDDKQDEKKEEKKPEDKPEDKPQDKPGEKPEDKPQDKPEDKSAEKPEDKPQDAPPPEQQKGQPGQQKPPASAEEMKEVEAILDSLERSPKSLEKERARLRAVRRRPPQKDW